LKKPFILELIFQAFLYFYEGLLRLFVKKKEMLDFTGRVKECPNAL